MYLHGSVGNCDNRLQFLIFIVLIPTMWSLCKFIPAACHPVVKTALKHGRRWSSLLLYSISMVSTWLVCWESHYHIVMTSLLKLLLTYQVVNGYFVHHFSPEGISPVSKNVVFVIDISGSMAGHKIDQTRDAMLTILDQLRDGDTFNIVLFHTTVSQWKSSIVEVTSNTVETAKTYIRGLEDKSCKFQDYTQVF